MNASDEMYFATCLALLQYISKQISSHNSNSNNNNSSTNSNNKKHNSDENQNSKTTTSSSSSSSILTTSTTINQVCNRRVTYCDWISKGDRSPKTFYDLNKTDIDKAVREGCLFFRKLVLPTTTNSNTKSASMIPSSSPIIADTAKNSNSNKEQILYNHIEKWLELALNINKSEQPTEFELYMERTRNIFEEGSIRSQSGVNKNNTDTSDSNNKYKADINNNVKVRDNDSGNNNNEDDTHNNKRLCVRLE